MVYALERALREEPVRELTNHPDSSKFLVRSECDYQEGRKEVFSAVYAFKGILAARTPNLLRGRRKSERVSRKFPGPPILRGTAAAVELVGPSAREKPMRLPRRISFRRTRSFELKMRVWPRLVGCSRPWSS